MLGQSADEVCRMSGRSADEVCKMRGQSADESLQDEWSICRRKSAGCVVNPQTKVCRMRGQSADEVCKMRGRSEAQPPGSRFVFAYPVFEIRCFDKEIFRFFVVLIEFSLLNIFSVFGMEKASHTFRNRPY